jgi:hypothetical protein
LDGFGASAPGVRLFLESMFPPARAAERVPLLRARRHAPTGNEGS